LPFKHFHSALELRPAGITIFVRNASISSTAAAADGAALYLPPQPQINNSPKCSFAVKIFLRLRCGWKNHMGKMGEKRSGIPLFLQAIANESSEHNVCNTSRRCTRLRLRFGLGFGFGFGFGKVKF